MAVSERHIVGVPCRLFRVSFTGELGFEINVPSDYGRLVWEAVWAAGRRFGITPYGTEAMHVLRAEKGYIIVGQETDGTVTPDDLGLGGLDRQGQARLRRQALALPRPTWWRPAASSSSGCCSVDPTVVLDEGAQIVADPAHPVPTPMIGHVTSSYMSANLGRSIALALVADGRRRMRERLSVTTPTGFAEAEIVEPVFLDPQGVRLHA